jgi:hypothetical protein
MAATSKMWTTNEVGCSEGASGADDCKPDGQVDFAADFKVARQALPTQAPEHQFDFSGAPERVDVPSPVQDGSVPNPGCGTAGTPLDFNAVAPQDDSYIKGEGGAPAGASAGWVLFPGSD